MGMTVSVVGLGKLGGCMAAALASRDLDVIGVDVDPRAVEAVNGGRAPVVEPGLAERIAAADGRLRATTDALAAVRASDITFVIVPTPSEESGAFSLEHVAAALREVGTALSEKDAYHLVVVTSTVLPGSTRHALLPILEHASGKRAGADFGLCYSPAFIALGSVLRDFLNPDFVLIGELDERSGDILAGLYGRLLENDPPVRRMSLENAELTKLALNTFVTVKITFANMLADLCERIPGGDVDRVTSAIGLDRRVGEAYLKGGLGYGGPCFPRDNQALGFFARALSTTAALPEVTDAANRRFTERVLERLRPLAARGATIGVLGLAYKPGTPVVEGSQSLVIARELALAGARVLGYDPLAGEQAAAALGELVTIVDSADACLDAAEAVLVTTPDEAFRAIRPDRIRRNGHGALLLVDFWRALDHLRDAPGVVYVPIGRNTGGAESIERLEALWTPGRPARAAPRAAL